MNETLILGGILAVLWFGLLFLRVPSSIAFLSVLIGQLLATEATTDVYEFAGAVIRDMPANYVQATLLLLPFALTILFLRNHVARSKLLVELVPTLLLSALTILLAAPLIPALETVLNVVPEDQLSSYKNIIILAASVAGLMSAWIDYPKPAHPKDKHKA